MTLNIILHREGIEADLEKGEVSDEPVKTCRWRVIIQLTAMLSIVALCIVGIVTSKRPLDMNDMSLGGLTTVLGIMLPQPKIK